MPQTDPRIDAYIAKAQPFAQPILEHIRALVHRALPDVGETIKWGMPAFTLRDKNVAGMAAFKAHCALMVHGDDRESDAMGQYGRMKSVADLPSEAAFAASLSAAAERIASRGTAVRPTSRTSKAPIAMPEDFAAALAASSLAETAFAAFAPSHRREYLEWVTDAKRPETRAKRIAQAVKWIGEGKKRNWNYENC